jgi:hypothetical protein
MYNAVSKYSLSLHVTLSKPLILNDLDASPKVRQRCRGREHKIAGRFLHAGFFTLQGAATIGEERGKTRMEIQFMLTLL